MNDRRRQTRERLTENRKEQTLLLWECYRMVTAGRKKREPHMVLVISPFMR
jgi:hypothetical protein